MIALAHINFRKIAVFVAAAGTLFWLYTFYAIAHQPPGDGTGFEWLAVFPLGTVFGLFVLPAWLLMISRRLSGVSIFFGVCGLIAFAIVWAQLLNEFPKS